MSPVLLFSFVIGYFVLLLVVAWFTSRNSNNESFFIGNRKSNWVLVAFGMIGTSLSGVTFVSVPGAVGKPFAGGFEGFTYFQIVTDDMHTRKRTIYSMCDAGLILPGGFGTLDELFEMLTWNQLSIHDKEIFILNSGGFYEHLIAHISKMQEEQFLYEKAARRITILDEPEALLPFIQNNID